VRGKIKLVVESPLMKPNFGQAFTITEVGRENCEAELQRWTDEVMCRMAVRLLEEYRGVNRDHPRVKGLLA
jgi:1-acyl-sn-glycerol-3-phosphate acyltransferase